MASVTSVISIEGMTCQSCVRNIEGVVGGLSGVESVKVDLANKQGTVFHNPVLITGAQLAERIDDMGFEAKLKVQALEGSPRPNSSKGLSNQVEVADLLGEPVNCVCGDQLIQISVKGNSIKHSEKKNV